MKYHIKYKPKTMYPYFVYVDATFLDRCTTLWGAKRLIKKTQRKIKSINKANLELGGE